MSEDLESPPMDCDLDLEAASVTDQGEEPNGSDDEGSGTPVKTTKKGAKTKGKGRLKVVNKFGKTKGNVKAGKKFCPACSRWLPIEEFPTGSGQCGTDRKVMQNLRNAAVAQDQVAWWEDTVKDPEKLKHAVQAYKDTLPAPGKKRKQFVIVQYIEERRNESSVLLDGIQEMMDERHFMVWMAKPKNGCKDALEASAEWHKKCAAPGAIIDYKGPCEKYRKRVAIQVKDLVINRDAHIRSQGYVVKDKEVKKGDQAAIDKAEARLFKEQEFTASSARNKQDLAASMVAAAASSKDGAFSSDGKGAAGVGSLKDFIDSTKESQEQDEEEEDEDSKNSSPTKPGSTGASSTSKRKGKGEEESEKPGKKNKTWFDRDGAVTSAVKAHTTWLKNTATTITSTLENLQAALDQVTDDIQDEVKNEQRLAKNRLYALKLIYPAWRGDDPEAACQAALQNMSAPEDVGKNPEAPAAEATPGSEPKQEPNSEANAQGSGDDKKIPAAPSTVRNYVRNQDGDPQKALRKYIASFSSDEKKELGNAAPCRSYQSLIVFSEFADKTAEIEAAQTKDDIVKVQTGMKVFKSAYQDLLSMAKAAKNRLESAVADARKQLLKKQSDDAGAKTTSKRGRPKKAAQAEKVKTVAENPEGFAKDIESVVMNVTGKLASELNLSLPCIVRVPPEKMKELSELQSTTIATLEAKFKNSPSRTEAGRSQKGVPQAQRGPVRSLLNSLFADDYLLPAEKIPEKLKADVLSPVAFVVAKGCVTCSAETGHLGTVRLGMGGTRKIVAAKSLKLLDHLSTPTSKADLQRCYHWMKSATCQAAKAFVDANNADTTPVLVHATVGVNDILYLPPGWLFHEVIIGNSDFLGVRLQHLALLVLPDLTAIHTHLLGIGKPNASLQSAIDCLSLAEA